jgi:hypothetical protein
MKRLICIVALSLFAQLGYAFDLMNHEIFIDKNLTLVFASKDEQSTELNYKIALKYPQLSGSPLSNTAEQFNMKMNEFIVAEMAEFGSKVADNAEAAKKLPLSAQNNYFNLNFNASVFRVKEEILMGIRFNKEYFYAGNAHPSHDIEVYNYDLTTGKELKLNELFIPKSDYLKVIADYCQKELSLRFKAQKVALIPEGVAPKEDNFINWNFEPDGLLFIFDEDQVASYDVGQPEVFVPYKVLKALLASDVPVALCPKDPKACIAV